MSLILPGNVPVAAESFEALLKLGDPWIIRDDPRLRKEADYKPEALVIVTKDVCDRCLVWASPKLRSYRTVWDQAAGLGFVDAASEWGYGVDIDHVFPKSWANLRCVNLKYVRLFPVWQEVNRGAGGGIEKAEIEALKSGAMIIPRKHGIVFAKELQLLKILGIKVGAVSNRFSMFARR